MTGETLAQFLARRNRELDEIEAPAKKTLDDVAAERVQLRRAAIAAGLGIEPSTGPPEAEQASRVIPRRLSRMTLKEAVLHVLEGVSHGLTATQILQEINTKFGSNFSRESLSPQLSRLKFDGHIELTGRIWHLPGQSTLQKEAADHNLFEGNGPAASQPQPASEAQGDKATPGGGT